MLSPEQVNGIEIIKAEIRYQGINDHIGNKIKEHLALRELL
jgi:hypothetical protein